jgi:flagellar biosynthesis/type III secretory pathway chaperone
VVNVGKPSVRAQILLYIRESIQEKNLINVVIVVKVLASAQTWLNMKESTQERSLLCVTSVTNISVRVLML